MRVVHVIDHMGLGGAQAGLLDLVEAQPHLAVTIVALRARHPPAVAARLERAGIGFLCADLAPGRPGRLFDLRTRIHDLRPDIAHLHLEWSCHLAGPLVLSLGRHRPRLVIHVDNDPRCYAPAHRLAARWLARHADAHIVPGASITRALAQVVGTPLVDTIAIPNGIVPTRFHAANAVGPVVEALRGGAPFVIGAVGRLVAQKNLDVLLDILPRLRATLPGLRLLLVGDGKLRVALERRVAALGLTNAVHFAGERPDLASVYAALDALVLPSHHEGQGLVLLEAMAAGVPVVGTAVSGIEDVVQDGHNGLLVPTGRPDLLCDAVLRVLREQELRRRLVDTARQNLEPRYAAATVASQTEVLYRRVLERRVEATTPQHRLQQVGEDTG